MSDEQQGLLKSAKDSLVSSLFELSKAARETADATINFYNLASNDKTGESFKAIITSLNAIQNVTSAIAANPSETGVEEKAEAPQKKKRVKVEKDPNAPKKPLTVFFAYSAHVRNEYIQDRQTKNLPALSSTELTQEISKAWSKLPAAEKEEWQRKYKDELTEYQKKRDDYLATKDGPEAANAVNGISSKPSPATKNTSSKASTTKLAVASPTDLVDEKSETSKSADIKKTEPKTQVSSKKRKTEDRDKEAKVEVKKPEPITNVEEEKRKEKRKEKKAKKRKSTTNNSES